MVRMDLEQLWQLTLGEMEVQLSRANFATWLKGSRLVDKKDGVFLVGVSNNFAKEWVENKYQKVLLGIIRGFDDSAKKLEFVVDHRTSVADPTLKKITSADVRTFGNQMDLDFKVDPETNLNPRYSAATFVVGASNELAYTAASAIVQEPGTKYNPFFVYG